MKILALETSGVVAGAVLIEDNMILSEFVLNNKLTHSQTIMPMVDEVLKKAQRDISEIDYFACSNGPGSFTGLRIGAATVKGFGLSLKKPVIGVPTLDALAYGIFNNEKIICPMTDARRSEVYTGFYTWEKGKFKRLSENAVLHIDRVLSLAEEYNKEVIFLGDGIKIHGEKILQYEKFSLAPACCNMPRASNVAVLAREMILSGEAGEFKIEYLQKSQAERERLQKEMTSKGKGKSG